MTDRNLDWGKVVAQALWQAGVRQVCISPGSRSTPLVLGLYLLSQIDIYVQIDERSAGFFALGMAKAQRRPVALVCTSGSAVSHYFPAVIEAYYSHVPLVILSADRPPELRHCGAQQTIDQLHIFGHYVRQFVEVGLPTANDRYLATLIQATVSRSLQPLPGAVHLNFAFSEPLAPPSLDSQFYASLPTWQHLGTKTQLENVDLLRELLASKRRGVVVVGVNKYPLAETDLVHKLAQTLGYPLLAEATGMPRQNVISHYDSFLRSPCLAERLEPEIVLRLGDMPTSKSYRQWLEQHPHCQQITIGSYDNSDPTHGNNYQVPLTVTDFCQQLLPQLQPQPLDREWLQLWEQANSLTQIVLDEWMAGIDYPFEGKIYYELAAHLPDQTIIYIGNSTPIRDLDSYFHNCQRVTVFANRGTNGIDGMISSAMGVAKVVPKPVLLICGDLTFCHDINGLLLGKLNPINLTILLIDNQGGAIFEMLPISRFEPPFRELFLTPIGIDLAQIATGYGADWHQASTISQVTDLVKDALTQPGVQIISIKTDGKKDWQQRHNFWQKVIQTIETNLLAPSSRKKLD
ncbi:MAG: 2-succinyl-5-enolpyruvyl-6-hydroxy-3-cyclohexene-1-carboxylic-acid synthase [Pseudanabaenaceae cyanobacterium SKYGB_i_bin29]|nr:2-succinyl-5-enolpyruvyl-6-hydroxy-3-cyclohexene-1-carboxylic-acid synthase [Pseudanabaenaceae cyanobacterium SKYG29]MDW8420646.1 2-succinyl-5-enolpyruvyl-6-hydroxy-3-cyclohexene-1-carboxylic-acid synthase [Pseudanabaenaceae cyanobacterium SKYGB_i_bin29]